MSVFSADFYNREVLSASFHMEEKEAEAKVRQGNQSLTARRSGAGGVGVGGRIRVSVSLFLFCSSLLLGGYCTRQVFPGNDNGGGGIVPSFILCSFIAPSWFLFLPLPLLFLSAWIP